MNVSVKNFMQVLMIGLLSHQVKGHVPQFVESSEFDRTGKNQERYASSLLNYKEDPLFKDDFLNVELALSESYETNFVNPKEGEALTFEPDRKDIEGLFMTKSDTVMVVSEETTKTNSSKEVERSRANVRHESVYAVQILALPKGINPRQGFFDQLDDWKVEVAEGKDGVKRYYIKVYHSKSEAHKAVKAIQSQGYLDAFIRPLLKYAVL